MQLQSAMSQIVFAYQMQLWWPGFPDLVSLEPKKLGSHSNREHPQLRPVTSYFFDLSGARFLQSGDN